MADKARKTVTEWKGEICGRKNDILADLRQYVSVVELREIPAASWNAVFLGLGERTDFFVKVINEESNLIPWSEHELNYVGCLMEMLKKAGFAHILPPVDLGREQYACRCAGSLVQVYPWESSFQTTGRASGESVVEVEACAQLLCDLHKAGRRLARVVGPRKTSIPRAYGPSQWAAKFDEVWRDSRTALHRACASRAATAALFRGMDLSRELFKRYATFFSNSADDCTIVHGDFRPQNVHQRPDGSILLFDFDMAHAGVPEEDVAYGALSHSGPEWFCGAQDWSQCGRFIHSYCGRAERCGLSPPATKRIEAALIWTVAKELSLSFKPAQVLERFELLSQMTSKIDEIMQQIWSAKEGNQVD